MGEISIELLTRGEATTSIVLESIGTQSFDDYSVTCVNSSGNDMISDLLEKHGVKEVKAPSNINFLKARYLAHINSSGDYRLLLDSTRPLEPDALKLLSSNYNKYPAVCIQEDSIGEGFWVRQADKLRAASEKTYDSTAGKRIAYILPRFFYSAVLDSAFRFLTDNIDPVLFEKIGYGEHHLIYEAAELKESEVTLTKEVMIRHFEDSSAIEIFRKYNRYGRSQKILNDISFETEAKKLSSHKRPFSVRNLRMNLESLPLRFLRTTSFMLGYLLP